MLSCNTRTGNRVGPVAAHVCLHAHKATPAGLRRTRVRPSLALMLDAIQGVLDTRNTPLWRLLGSRSIGRIPRYQIADYRSVSAIVLHAVTGATLGRDQTRALPRAVPPPVAIRGCVAKACT